MTDVTIKITIAVAAGTGATAVATRATKCSGVIVLSASASIWRSKRRVSARGTRTAVCKMYVGDKRCDDLNNNCACNWDKGDCCGVSDDSLQFEYCEKCRCLDLTYKPKKKCDGNCHNVKWKGDGNCDDENNICGCSWDGEEM